VKTPKRPKNRTKNPEFQMFGKMPTSPFPADSTLEIDIHDSNFDGMTGIAADLMIQSALLKATDNEKMLIAAIIPMFLKFLRPKKKSSKPSKTTSGRTDRTEAKTEAK
jgi:hypothetical protein